MKNTPAQAAAALKAKFSSDGRVLAVETYGNDRLLVIVKPNGHEALGVGSNALRKFQGYQIIVKATKS